MSQLVDFRLPGDEAIFFAVNRHVSDWLDGVYQLASWRPFGLAMLGVVFLAWLRRLGKRAIWPVALTGAVVGVSDLFGHWVLRPAFARMRPCYALDAAVVRKLADAANVGSLPSLHSANAFTAATVTMILWPRLGLGLLPIATLVAVSRIGVGVHWPSDVAAGIAYGALLGAVGGVVGRRLLGAARLEALASPSPAVAKPAA